MHEQTDALAYSDEEGDFYIDQVHRIKPFGRTNHYHRTYEIYYLLSGQRAYFINDRSYQVYAGDLVFISKYVVHKTSDYGEPGHERIVINFSDSFLGSDQPLYTPELFRAFQQNSQLIRLKANDQVLVQSLLNKMTKEAKALEMGYETYIRLLLIELLLIAARCIERNFAVDHEHKNPVHLKISDVVKHINVHYPKKLTLPELSKTFFMSPFYLSRTFKSVTGFTCIEYVNLTRIKEAQRLLKETNLKISDIALTVGFDNSGHFIRIFKKISQTTPSSYRKMNAVGRL